MVGCSVVGFFQLDLRRNWSGHMSSEPDQRRQAANEGGRLTKVAFRFCSYKISSRPPERHSAKRPALPAAGGFAHYEPLSFARSAPIVGEAKEVKGGGFRLPLTIFSALRACESHHSSLF